MKYNKHTLIISIPQFTPQTPKHQTTISLSRTKARNHLQIKYMKSSNHHKKFAILYLKMWFHHILHPKILLCSLHYHLSCCKKRYINPNYRTCNLTIPTPISSRSSVITVLFTLDSEDDITDFSIVHGFMQEDEIFRGISICSA